MRRNTLGPISASAANSRGMSGPGRAVGVSGAKPSAFDRRSSAVPSLNTGPKGTSMGSGMSGRRHSTLTTTSGQGRGAGANKRQSSIAGHRGASLAYPGRRTDPRPSNDRAYMQSCVKNIVEFVVHNGYGMPISPKILTNPSSRDFQQIFLFLMRYLDPTFTFEKRFEEEVPAVMKCLGYPFNISKSALSAVGSPHTWPTLLGVLTWILEAIRYDEARAMKESEPSPADEADLESSAQSKLEQLFIENVNAAYSEFLAGADEFPELDQALEDQFEADNAEVRKDVARLEAAIEEQTEVLRELEGQENQLDLLAERKTTIETNIQKYKSLVATRQEYKNGVEKKEHNKAQELEALSATVVGMTEEVARLQAIVASQEQEDGISVERIRTERANLKEALARLDEERHESETGLHNAESNLKRLQMSLSDSVRHYNTAAQKLLITPATAKHANGKDYSLEVVSEVGHVSSPGGARVLTLDIVEVVLPALRDLKTQFYEKQRELRSTELEQQDRLDANEEQLLVVRSEHGKQEAKYAKLDGEYREEMTGMAEQLERSAAEANTKEAEIASREREVHDRVQESTNNLQKLETQLRSFDANFVRERHRFGVLLAKHADRMMFNLQAIRESTEKVALHFAEEINRAQEEDTTHTGVM